MKQLLDLYRTFYDAEPTVIEPIIGSGSARKYYRLSSANNSAIGTIGTDKLENRAFIGLTKHFAKQGLPVPEVLAVSEDQMAYLQTDLGHLSLYDAVKQGRDSGIYSNDEEALLTKAIKLLPRFQTLGVQGLDINLCYPTGQLDSESIHFDLNYFKYCFLKLLPDFEFNEFALQRDLNNLAKNILKLTTEGEPTLMLRDFQARNVIIGSKTTGTEDCNNIYIIDYQGCRLGPAEYDLASFLWQSSARYPQPLRERLVELYIQARNEITPTDACEVRSRLQLMVLFRLLQVLGAYGFRGLYERKQYFISSIAPALENLRDTIQTFVLAPYPYLSSLLAGLAENPQIATLQPSKAKDAYAEEKVLTVTIYSFSYKRGIPLDPSSNGGGYVFDCRGSNNPGRYEQYKSLTGLDEPVINYLEQDGEIVQFLSHIYPLAEAHVARYIERHFTHLMFCFGCTGGQHRSVYCAQHLADHLHRLFPQIKIDLTHRELG